MENISQEINATPETNLPPVTKTAGSSYSRRTIMLSMLTLFLIFLLASLDQDIVATAMPRILGELHGFDRYVWVGMAYTLTATITIPIYGKLSDIVGRKRVLLTCILVFLCGSALSGASQTMDQLILCRGLQGLGAGGIPPVITATVADLLSPRERGKWMGAFGSVIGLSSILGPILGGWITDHASWRWVFYVNLPFGIITLLVLIFLMPSLRQPRANIRIDYLGALLLVVGAVPMLLGLSSGSQYSWLSWQILGLIGGGLVVLVCFLVYEASLERRDMQPIVSPRMFKNRVFSFSLVITMISFTGLFGSVAFLPLYVQGVLNISATDSGLMLTPMMIGVIVGSIISGQLISRLGKYKWLAITGMGIAIIGSGLLLRLNVHSTYIDVVVAMAVLGLGFGAGMAIYSLIVQSAMPENIGQATAMMEFVEQMGGPVALAIMGSILTSSYTPAFYAALPASVKHSVATANLSSFNKPDILFSPDTQQAIAAKFALLGSQGHALLSQIMEAVKVGLTQSIHTVFLVGFVVLLLGLVVVFFLPVIELRSSE